MFALKNLSSSDIAPVVPWKTPPALPKFKSKPEFISWAKKPTTQHCFYSGYEGLNPAQRISKSNPAHAIHAVVADYDCEIKDLQSEINRIIANAPSHATPNWISITFSGGLRLVWVLEEPVLVHSPVHKEFLKKIAKELKLQKLAPGWDEGFYDSAKYYALGHSWKAVSPTKLSTNLIYNTILEVSSKGPWRDQSTSIPIDLVAEEVEKKYPGKWSGEFVLGNRGPRFWEDGADNPTAAIIRESGMQCFTGTQAFVPWSTILGVDFVKKFEADRVGAAIRDIWFDGKNFWKKNANGLWVSRMKPDLALYFKSVGLSGDGDVDTLSEIENALLYIQEHKQVEVVVPLVHSPDGINYVLGRPYLNCSSVKCLLPSQEVKDVWGDKFEWLANFFAGFFDPQEQLEYFLAWLQRLYKSSLAKTPLSGQAVFVAGPVSQGKTFLSNYIISKMLGGHADASDFLLGDTNFNDHLFSVAVWTVDDTTPGADPSKHTRYSAIVKKMAANKHFLINGKYKGAAMIPWRGRVFITCNTDSESTRILPDVDQSLLDKVCLFKCADRDVDFTNVEQVVDNEISYFCKWLLDWKPPENVLEFSRYGVASYHHPDLLQAAKDTTYSNAFFEILVTFLSEYFTAEGPNQTEWIGSATDLLQQLNRDDGMRSVVSKWSTVSIGRALGQLKNQGFDVDYYRATFGLRKWVLPKSLTKVTEEDKAALKRKKK